MKNILKVVFVIIGTLIGAGFASGKEIYIFFFSYGMKGFLGILISSLVIGWVIEKSLKIIYQKKIENYEDFLDAILTSHSLKRDKKEKFTKIKKILNSIINLFILVTFFIMIAGFGAYFEQELAINSIIGSGILAILCLIILMTSVKGVVKVNEILVPILIGFLIIIGILNIKEIQLLELENYIIATNSSNYIVNAILYSSYNSILLIPVLITLRNYLKNKKQIACIAGLTSIIVIALSSIIFLILVRIDVDISKLEMPAVYVVSHMSKLLKYGYGMIILGSIFTTAISLGTSFLQNITKSRKGYTQMAVIMCITSVLVSKVGFSNLVNALYPIFGYMGLAQIIKLIFTKSEKNKR